MNDKKKKLMDLARRDEIYMAYQKTWEDSQAAFDAYVNAQPILVQRLLRCHTQAARMAAQRLLELACENWGK